MGTKAQLEQVKVLLTDLSGVLGKSADYLWQAAFKQAFWIEGVLQLAVLLVLTWAVIYGTRLALEWVRKRAKEQGDALLLFQDNDELVVRVIGGALLLLIAVGIWDALTSLLNPGYHALLAIAKLIQ